ncbi:uncharacterized protein DDB_G0271670-like [Daktulosphaira vitifoliae]|uniref:uncharacterized protein DDB_G0271670-like n=1 Tax=Daktulosphaira vitifoliae TaxID=58002 RepID=UPI0021AAF4A5|nr:uncharacterized protein DDB_G0271670-like [Daktulosphaira vitifoliae]
MNGRGLLLVSLAINNNKENISQNGSPEIASTSKNQEADNPLIDMPSTSKQTDSYVSSPAISDYSEFDDSDGDPTFVNPKEKSHKDIFSFLSVSSSSSTSSRNSSSSSSSSNSTIASLEDHGEKPTEE